MRDEHFFCREKIKRVDETDIYMAVLTIMGVVTIDKKPSASEGLVSNTTQKSVDFSMLLFISKNPKTITLGIIVMIKKKMSKIFLYIPFRKEKQMKLAMK